MDSEIFVDENILDVIYTAPRPSGCRVTAQWRATCPTCSGLPFPLRDTAREARADADEHDRVARHGLVAGSVSSGRKVNARGSHHPKEDG